MKTKTIKVTPTVVPPEEIPGRIFGEFGDAPFDHAWDFGGISRRGARLKGFFGAIIVYDTYHSFESRNGEKDFRITVYPSEQAARETRNWICVLTAELVPFGGNIIVMGRGGLKRRMVNIRRADRCAGIQTLYDPREDTSTLRLRRTVDAIETRAKHLIKAYRTHLLARCAA